MARETRFRCDLTTDATDPHPGGDHRVDVRIEAVWSEGLVRASDLHPRPFPDGLCFCSFVRFDARTRQQPEAPMRKTFAPNDCPPVEAV